jgi:cell pole-organizing protein PopZ
MSDDGQQEPSIDDILASIRKILSEDEEGGEGAVAAAPEEDSAPEPMPEPEPEPDVEEDDGPGLAPFLAEDDDDPEPEPAPPVAELDALELTDSMMVEEQGQEEAFGEPMPKPEAVPPLQGIPEQPYQPYDQEGLVADQVEHASGSHIAQLAQAVAQERALTLGNQGITMEQLVREICTPVLKHWLDHNLPYMVERIVGQEIERIVSRSERM